MIRFENVTTKNFDSLSFEIEKASAYKIITNSDYENRELLNIMLGLEKPEYGRVFIFNEDLCTLPEKELGRLFSRVGAVLIDGGMISNLKVWENIVLPVWYHSGKISEDIEKKAIQRFEETGMDISYLGELMGKLPGPLPVHEKRLIGFIRASLLEPELMIYDSIFEGLSPEMSETLIRVSGTFHSGKAGRTSVYITPDEQSVEGIKADTVLRL
ncbi:MAG: hypothetical protein HY957_08255 [Nitrospirae bacterium]|nr:hypothetical protein [Nitrospirota bacterium]